MDIELKKRWSWTTSCGTVPVVICARVRRRILMMKGASAVARASTIRRRARTSRISGRMRMSIDLHRWKWSRSGTTPSVFLPVCAATSARGAGGWEGTATTTARRRRLVLKIVRSGSTRINFSFLTLVSSRGGWTRRRILHPRRYHQGFPRRDRSGTKTRWWLARILRHYLRRPRPGPRRETPARH